MSKPPFKALSRPKVNLEEADAAIKDLAADQNIVDLSDSAPVRSQPAKPQPVVEADDEDQKGSVDLPRYVWKALKMLSAKEDATSRYFILKGLDDAGIIDVKPEHLVKDKRRNKAGA